jgi:hypothetical protein
VRLWPYQRAIADAISDPLIERVALVKAARVGFPQRFRFAAFAPDPGSGLYATSGNAQEGASIPANYLTAWQLPLET